MSDQIKEAEERFAELLRECAKTINALAEHVEEHGFQYQYVMRTFLKCHEEMGAVRDIGMLIIQMRQARVQTGFDQRNPFDDSLFS